jgi:hypothetical protein
MIGRPKIELPKGAIERMDLLLENDPELFDRYAREDAIIAGLYYIRVRKLLAEKFGVTEHKPTLGSIGVVMIKQLFAEHGLDPKEYCGYTGAGDKKQWSPSIAEHIAFAANTYHGGRNEADFIGPTPQDTSLIDVDLTSAYTTAMAIMGLPDWPSTKIEMDINRLAVVDEALTFARVNFAFPADTLYPCLPVRADNNHGLLYPLKGVSYCTGPELVVALRQGAKLDIEHGLRIEWKTGEKRPFEDFTRRINNIRANALKKGMLDKTAKEIGNSAYGKMAQAVQTLRTVHDNGISGAHGKRTFDSRTQQMKTLPVSSITNPMLASFITGIVRAMLSEALAALPADALVCTATTDGFLSNIPVEQLDVSGPVARVFAAARARITPEKPDVWEEKHRVGRVLVLKTRGTITMAPFDTGNSGNPVLARAGHKLERRDMGPWAECSEWLRMIQQRDYETHCQRHTLTSLRDQNLFNCDLVGETVNARMNFDYDMKRQPIEPFDRDGLLCANTRPWNTLEEFTAARAGLELWKKSKRRVLKTLADYNDMIEWVASREGQRASGSTSQSGRAPFINAFMRAATRGGLSPCRWTYARLAALLNACGVQANIDTLKKAKARGTLALGQIRELAPDEITFARAVHRRHPECQLGKLVAPNSSAAKALADLRSSAICDHCGAAFSRSRSTAKFCSDACRKAAKRKSKRAA